MVLEWSHCLNSEMMACLLERKDPFLLVTTLSSQDVRRAFLLTVSTEAPESPAGRGYRLSYFTAEDIGDPAVFPGSTQPITWQSWVRKLSCMACSSRDTVLSRPLDALVLSSRNALSWVPPEVRFSLPRAHHLCRLDLDPREGTSEPSRDWAAWAGCGILCSRVNPYPQVLPTLSQSAWPPFGIEGGKTIQRSFPEELRSPREGNAPYISCVTEWSLFRGQVRKEARMAVTQPCAQDGPTLGSVFFCLHPEMIDNFLAFHFALDPAYSVQSGMYRRCRCDHPLPPSGLPPSRTHFSQEPSPLGLPPPPPAGLPAAAWLLHTPFQESFWNTCFQRTKVGFLPPKMDPWAEKKTFYQ